MQKKSLFGTSGIRGPVDTFLTEQFCFDIAKTFIEFLKQNRLLGPIAVGMDPRKSSPRIKKQVFKGLATGKVKLFDEGVTPVPSLNWLIKATPIAASIMVTGSHIAPELNGLKFYAHNEEISLKDQKEIENIYLKIKNKEKPPKLFPTVHLESRARQLYFEMLFKLIVKPLPRWKVCLDCANGCQSLIMPELLRNLGLQVIEVNCNPQKNFIARDTDTDDKAKLEELKKIVKKEACDFGIAFDGDGDRVVFVDEKGSFVQGEYSCSLIAKNSSGNVLVTTISASQVVDNLGKKVIRTKVGSPYVIAKMKEVSTSFGFEPNGGAIWADIMYTRDGGSMTMKILNLFSEFKGTFSEMVNQLPKFYVFRTKVDYQWELKDKIIQEAKKQFKGERIEEIDGLKIWLDNNTWILFRSSKNAPEFRVFSESESEKKSKELLKKGLELVKSVVSSND